MPALPATLGSLKLSRLYKLNRAGSVFRRGIGTPLAGVIGVQTGPL